MSEKGKRGPTPATKKEIAGSQQMYQLCNKALKEQWIELAKQSEIVPYKFSFAKTLERAKIMSQSDISNWKSGKKIIKDIRTIRKLSTLTGISPTLLITIALEGEPANV